VSNPDEDTPRLVLADWLEEFGDEHDRARAEFIRVQCQRESLPWDHPKQKELGRAERRLRRDHVRHWLGPLFPYAGRQAFFERGLLDDWAPFATEFLKQAHQKAVCDWFPVIGVKGIYIGYPSRK